MQFGFKKKMGCSHAIFALHQCVDYFVKTGSSVFMAALDANKAFDRVNHIKLFHRLLDKGMPIFVVKLIANWYSKNMATVRWNNHHSEFFHVKSGVRQGGVLSPTLFNIYTVSQKKQDTKLLPITSPNVNRFSKFFHCQTHW